MRNRIIYTCLLLMILLCSTTHGWRIVDATESTKKYILECIRIRVALENGNFRVSNTLQQYDINGSKWIRTLTVCSNQYRFIDTITFKPYVRRHSIGLYTDLSVVGARYGFTLYRGWGLTVQADTSPKVYGGIEKRF